MRLTKPQLDELRRLAKAPQATSGAARARVQNNLVRLGLALIIGFGFQEECHITAAGRMTLRGT